jgi:PQQ-dependent catabolism-associated beta-propeller protein
MKRAWLIGTLATAVAAAAGWPVWHHVVNAAREVDCALFVSNERARTVSVIDTVKDRVVRTMRMPARPRGIAASGDRLFVALSDIRWQDETDADGILSIDVRSGRVLTRFDAGSDPERFVLSRDRQRLVATNEDAGTATVTSLDDGRHLATLIVGIEPEGVAVSPDGRWAYVTAETSNTVSVIDLASLSVVSTFLVDSRPRDVAFSPDGSRGYVTSEIGGTVAVVDTSHHRVIDTIALAEPAKPVGIAVGADGWIYVATGHANSVSFIDPGSLEVAAVVPVGQRPWGIALSPAGRKLYTANGVSNDVSVVDVRARRLLATIPTGDGAWGLAFDTRPANTSRGCN